MIYPRKVLQEIMKYIESKEIIVLTGMRQVGKTTLYRIIFDSINSDNKIFLDVENPIDQKVFEEEDFNNIVRNFERLGIDSKKKMYTFIDEIQAMPGIVKAIRYLYDNYDIKFFITGSSSFYLKSLFTESLAGRKFLFEMFPLDFEEFLIFKNQKRQFYEDFEEKDKQKNFIIYEKLKRFYDEYLEFGGFPAVVLAENVEEKKMKLKDIFKSYFEKDIKILADFKDIRAMRELILLVMQRCGSKLEITKLASEIGVSRETIYSYLNFLEGTYFILLVTPFSRNVDREVSGSRKIYLCDNGLLNNFSKVSEGSLFENAVFLNLKKYGKINYYQKRTGGEIDFIINKEIAIEVKLKGTESDLKKLERISASLDIKDYYLITKDFSNEKGFIPAMEV
jgi:predicted AAA+ superfamily ATPase